MPITATGFSFPTTDTASSGTWTTPTNVQAADTTNLASTTIAAKNTNSERDCGGFGFSIPAGAVITKVEIKTIHKTSTTSSIATVRVAGKVGATVLASHDDATEPAALSTITYDITADRAWAAADFANGTFFVRFSAIQGNSATSCTYSWDAIEVQVTYTTVLTVDYVDNARGVSRGVMRGAA